MMLFQDGPIESFNYMVAGFTVILGAIGIFIFSLVSRFRRLKQEEASLELIEEDQVG
jgi:hypothetical protein